MENNNKYVDAILDRIGCIGIEKIDSLDKEYLSRIKDDKDASDIEKQYEEFDIVKNFIFKKREPNTKDWNFIVVDEQFLWYDKITLELKQFGDSVWFYEWNDKKVYLRENTIKELEDEGDCDFISTLIRQIYYSTNKEQLMSNITELIKNEKPFNEEHINGNRWVICERGGEFEIGMGYTPEDEFDYSSCPFEFFKVKFNQ